MKRFISIILILAAAALALTSCDTAEVDGAGQGRDRFGKQMLLHATLADSPATKTAVQANGTSVYWTPGDQLNVFHGSAYSGKFVSVNTEPAASADFGGSLDQVPGASVHSSDMYWAVYPYDADNTCDGSSVTLTLPSSQTAVAGTFAQGIFPAVAKSSTLDMSFRNVCGGACFTVATEGISSVVFKGRGGESLAGKVKVAFDASGNPVVQEVVAGVDQVVVFAPDGGCFTPGVKYYAVILPQTLSGGLDIIYRTSTRKATYILARSIPVQRSAFGLVNGYDAGLQFESMPIDRTMFPDQVFADYIFDNFDRDHDGVLSNAEMNDVTWIQVSTDNIVSVKGIEYFPNLEGLDCSGGRVYNEYTGNYDPTGILASIDISANTALMDFRCPDNAGVTEIDFTNNTELISIDISNNSLTSIDVSNCVKLQSLNCESNKLQRLDVSMMPDLFELFCSMNQLASLDVSHNTRLRSLNCYGNILTALDVSGNTDLVYLMCPVNQISSLVIGSNTKLVELSCDNNRITGLNLSELASLEQLYVYNNPLGTLDVTNNAKLRELDCDNTGLTSLDISHNPDLDYLYFSGNSIRTLDLSHNPALATLSAGSNKLTSLDLTANPLISRLYCEDNPLGQLYILAGQPFSRIYLPDGVSVLTRAQTWSVIGDFNDWSGDVMMTETSPGIWVSPAFNCTGSDSNGVKLRQDGDWLVNLGGEFQALGTPFSVIRDGENIALPGGYVVITLDVTNPFYPMVTVNQGDVEVVPSNQIWYTSTDGSVIEFYYAPNDPTDANVVSNTYSDGKGIITFDGTVTRLGQQAFSNKTKLSSIQLPSTLTYISASSLGSTSLTQLDIPEGVTRLSNAALANNALLQRVYVPASLINYGDFPFYGCPSLRRFEGPYATADGRGLICNNRLIAIAPAGLTSFNVPDGVERILTRAFYGYEGLTYISLPSSLLYINGEAFQGSGIVNITIPENVQNIYWGAFRNCTSLQSVTCLAVNPPAGGDGMFDNTGNCPILVPSGSVDAYKNADYWSAYADRIQAMPSALWSVIGEFNGWSADLDMAETSPGVFVSPAFNYVKAQQYGGFKLRKDHSWDVTLGGTFIAFGQPFAAYDSGDNIIPSENGKIIVTLDTTNPSAPTITVTKALPPDNEIWYTTTDGSVAALQSSGSFGANVVSNTYQNGLGIIELDGPATGMTGDNPFRGTKVNHISLPETAVNFQYGFEGCYSLASVNFPSHLETVPSHLFAYNNVMTEFDFPETDDIAGRWTNGPIAFVYNLGKVTGPYATADNRSLIKNGKLFAHAGAGFSSYAIPEGVLTIGPEAFAGYSGLTDVTIPSSVQSIGYLSFARSGLTHIDLPESLAYIENYAFSNCTGLVSVHLPENTDIGEQVFDGCTSLESFTGHYASADNRLLVKDNLVYAIAPGGLTSYSIPEGITGIYSGLGLEAYLQLESLELPSTISNIQFLCGNRLKTLVIKAEVPPTVPYEWSLRMDNIEAIYVPAASVNAYKTALYWSSFADKFVGLVDQRALNYLTTATNNLISVLDNCSGSVLSSSDSLSLFNAAKDLALYRSMLVSSDNGGEHYLKYRSGGYIDSTKFRQLDFRGMASGSGDYCFAPDGTEVGAFQNIFSQLISPSFAALFTTTGTGGCLVSAMTDKNIINDQEYNAFLGLCRYDVATSKVVQIGF